MSVPTMHTDTWDVWETRRELARNLFTISASDFGKTAQCVLMPIGNGRPLTFFCYCADVAYLPDH